MLWLHCNNTQDIAGEKRGWKASSFSTLKHVLFIMYLTTSYILSTPKPIRKAKKKHLASFLLSNYIFD